MQVRMFQGDGCDTGDTRSPQTRVAPFGLRISVKEYWIVLGTERRVEVYRRPEQGRYQEMRVCGSDDWLESGAIPGVRLRVSELFS